MGFFSFLQSPPPEPHELPAVREEDLERIIPELQRGRKIQAIKELRLATGMGLKQAKDYVEAMEAGRQVPTISSASLADRARELRGAGRPAAALELIASETGMTEPEAARFLDCLDPEAR
jgi:large subunit ribosomal protein L7/L12